MDATPSPLKNVLLVDDDPLVTRLLGRYLQDAGYAVEAATDGAQGLRMFEEKSWTLVITDRVMPDMGGEELAAAIRKADPNVPILLITGAVHTVQRRDLFDDVLAKPFTHPEFIACITRILAQRSR